MRIVEPQYAKAQARPAPKEPGLAGAVHARGGATAQLAALAASGARAARLEHMADQIHQCARVQAAQRFSEDIHGAPLLAAQRKVTEGLLAEPRATGLPAQLKAGIEDLSGMSMDHVRVHYNSAQPAQLQARAYAQGAEIHVAPGQERHLPHEAWHVVQQAQGRVRPTMQMKDGPPVNDDAGLEQEADAMGARAMAAGLRGPVQLKRLAGGAGNLLPAPVQRLIAPGIDHGPLGALVRAQGDDLTYRDHLIELSKKTTSILRTARTYNQIAAAGNAGPRGMRLLAAITDDLIAVQGVLSWLIPGLAGRDDQSGADADTYAVLVGFQAEITQFSAAANTETAAAHNIVRAGAGGRPDANSDGALSRSRPGLGFNGGESGFIDGFVAAQGGSWKELREAYSGVWAKRAGQFNNLTPGKVNRYKADVEYKTTDAGVPELWDQKTMYTDQEAFDGRLAHTHKKNTDDNGRGVGLLLDSTYENPTNYEKNWLYINKQVLTNEVAPSAIKEIRAPNPGALQSDKYVEMAARYGAGTEEANIKWAEGILGAAVGGFPTIPAAQLGATAYGAVAAGTAESHSRYTNNRDWLPGNVVYDEYAIGGGISNPGKGRFVANADQTIIYMTVTHYSPYTVKLANNTIHNRPAFFRVQ